MARFGREFVRAATQPQFAQGLFTAAQQIGAAPRRRQEEEEKRKRLAQLRTMSPIEQAQYRIDTAETESELLAAQQAMQIAQQAQQETAREQAKLNYFRAMGKDAEGQSYVDLYSIGISERDIIDRYRENASNSTKVEYGKILGLPEDVVTSLTMDQLIDRVNAQKSQEGINEFASFMSSSKGVITEDNYDEAISKAVRANGVQGIQQVNNMYARTLERRAAAKKERIVEANVSLKSDFGIALPGGISNLTKVKVALDENGNLTAESKAYLNNVASSAFIPSIDKNWFPDEDNNGGNKTPEGEDPSDPSVGSLF